MRSISPSTGAPESTLAEEQHEYLPLTVAHYTDDMSRWMLTRWRLSKQEQLQVAREALHELLSELTATVKKCLPPSTAAEIEKIYQELVNRRALELASEDIFVGEFLPYQGPNAKPLLFTPLNVQVGMGFWKVTDGET